MGVGQRILISHLHQPQRLVAHAQTGRVHHHKHAVHAFVGCANQGAHGAIQNHLAGGAAFNAHFVFQAAAVDAIARAQAAVFVDQELGHDEQAHALDTGRRVA